VKWPRTPEQLAGLRGFSPTLARQNGQELIERIERVTALPEHELVPYPRRPHSGPGRPPAEAEERADRLRRVRNRHADELGIDRGILLPNAVLLEIARREPHSVTELATVPSLRRWQADILGEALVATLRRGGG